MFRVVLIFVSETARQPRGASHPAPRAACPSMDRL